MLIAFVVTLIPFFHGALRHLDDNYLIDEGVHRVKRTALAVDFGFLFTESCLLFALAHRIDQTNVFFLLFLTLLTVDIVWAIVFHLTSSIDRRPISELVALFSPKGHNLVAQLTWAANNLRFVAVIGVVGPFILWGIDHQPAVARFAVMTLAILRTTNDYRMSWDFYFPPAQPVTSSKSLHPFAGAEGSTPTSTRPDE